MVKRTSPISEIYNSSCNYDSGSTTQRNDEVVDLKIWNMGLFIVVSIIRAIEKLTHFKEKSVTTGGDVCGVCCMLWCTQNLDVRLNRFCTTSTWNNARARRAIRRKPMWHLLHLTMYLFLLSVDEGPQEAEDESQETINSLKYCHIYRQQIIWGD